MKDTVEGQDAGCLSGPENGALARQRRRIVGWLTACGVARLIVAWLMLPIAERFVSLNAFSRGLWVQEAALLVPVFFGAANPVMFGRYRPSQVDTTPLLGSLSRLRIATIVSALAVLLMTAGMVLGAVAGGAAPSIGLYRSAAVIAQTERHLAWLWWASAAGMASVMVSVAVQPWPLRPKTASEIAVVAAEASMLVLFLFLRNTLAALSVAILHLVVGNMLLFPGDWRYEFRTTDPDRDQRWLESHQDRL